jgi:iron complex transport system substrate-binding protein
MIDNLQKSGLKVLIQADWMEQTPTWQEAE